MDRFAELLEARIHRCLSPAQVKVHAAEIRVAAKQLRAAVDALAVANERVDRLQRPLRVLALAAHADLSSLKRLHQSAHLLSGGHPRSHCRSTSAGENVQINAGCTCGDTSDRVECALLID